MGARLAKAFDIAKDAGGMAQAMRLAMKSGMSAAKAAAEPDSPENISKMQNALKEVCGKMVTL